MYFRLEGWRDVTVAPDLSLERTLYPSTSSPPGCRQSLPTWQCDSWILRKLTVWLLWAGPHGVCHSWAGASFKTRSSGLSWPLFLPLAVRTLSSGKGCFPWVWKWEGLAQRSSLGGPQRHRPREPRGQQSPRTWVVCGLGQRDSLPEAALRGSSPPSGLLLTPPLPPPRGSPHGRAPQPPAGLLLLPSPLAGPSHCGTSSAVVPLPSAAVEPANQAPFPLAFSTCFWF